MKVAVRNVGGAAYGANPYRNREAQAATWRSLLATGADIVLAQEATGVNEPFLPPVGWRANPASRLDRGAGSVVAVAEHVDADLSWRPAHQALDAFDAYLDFALVQAVGMQVAVASVHVPTLWQPDHWASSGIVGKMPSSLRPWTSDVILDSLISVLDGREAIMAGDWNEALNYPGDDDPDAAAFFARAAAAGYVEVVNKTFGGPVRTNFARVAKRSYQNDHVFVTSGIAACLEQVAVFNEPAPGCSDHAGIVATFRD